MNKIINEKQKTKKYQTVRTVMNIGI